MAAEERLFDIFTSLQMGWSVLDTRVKNVAYGIMPQEVILYDLEGFRKLVV
jgi:hypothetical protein